MDDALIVRMFLDRDEQAIQETARKYGERLRWIGKDILEDPEMVSECENDTYLAAWNSIPPHEPNTYLFAFMARIMRNRALDKCREQARQKRSALLVELTAEMEQCIPSGANVEQKVEARALAEAISMFLRKQSKTKRDVFLRRYWYMDSIDEIAKQYHFSRSKVKSILMRMRKALGEFLEKEGYQL